MKKAYHLICAIVFSIPVSAQNVEQGTVNEKNISEVHISSAETVHLVSFEAIKYVDISSLDIEGDLPEKNILRLKVKQGNNFKNGESFVATVVTASFIASYKFTFSEVKDTVSYVVTIDPSRAIMLNDPAHLLGEKDYHMLALHALSTRRSIFNIADKKYDIRFWVNNIYIVGDFILLDLGSSNHSKIPFLIDEFRFKLVDAKQTNAHVSQEIELKPLYQLYPTDGSCIAKRNWRNIYIFSKFTYPMQKVLNIEMNEMQISGRTATLSIDYNQLLNAKFLN